jgi:hypothetical protein
MRPFGVCWRSVQRACRSQIEDSMNITYRTWSDLSGSKLGFLHVLRLVRLNPEPAYDVRCSNCGTETTMTHAYLRSTGVCKYSECRLIAERRAEREIRELYRPSVQTTRPLPPEDYRAWPAYQKVLAEWEKQQRERNQRGDKYGILQ